MGGHDEDSSWRGFGGRDDRRGARRRSRLAELLHRARRRSPPIAGPDLISAPRSATNGATSSNNPTRPSGVAGGLEAGFNWQHGNFVYGGEADIQLSGAEDTFAPWQFSNPWFGTVRGRAGVAIGNVLVFGTAGLAYGSLTANTPGNLSESHTSLGWVAGVGAEVGFTPHWSAKAEWLYLDLADRSYSVPDIACGSERGEDASSQALGIAVGQSHGTLMQWCGYRRAIGGRKLIQVDAECSGSAPCNLEVNPNGGVT